MPRGARIHIGIAEGNIISAEWREAGRINSGDRSIVDGPLYDAADFDEIYFMPREAEGADLCLASLSVDRVRVFRGGKGLLHSWSGMRREGSNVGVIHIHVRHRGKVLYIVRCSGCVNAGVGW